LPHKRISARKPLLNEKDIQLGAVGGDLLLGNENTDKIRLQANLLDTDGDSEHLKALSYREAMPVFPFLRLLNTSCPVNGRFLPAIR
jgi:hypothetical protein